MKYGEPRCQNKEKDKNRNLSFDGTGRNILNFHTKNGGGKVIFGIDVAK